MLVCGTQIIHAQKTPVWQTAESIRQHLFQAQQEMYAAGRAAEPAPHVETAVSHIQSAATLYRENLQPELPPAADAANNCSNSKFDASAANATD